MRGFGNSRQECLQTGLWKQPGRVLLGEGRFCSEVPEASGLTQNAPCPWLPGPDLPGLQWNWPMKKQVAGRVSRHARAPSKAKPR